MPTKHGLGRGLGALIPPPLAASPRSGVQEIDLAQIEPNPRQPRHNLHSPALEELAASIREHGLLQPLLLTSAPGSDQGGARYQLIAGERRWRAAKLAGLRHVPAIVRGTTPQQMLELALVENIQRADLNPLEEAEAYRELMDDFGLTQEQVARKVGKDRTTVANVLRLLKLPTALKEAVLDDEISEGHARALLQLNDETHELAVLKTVVARNLSVRQTEELVRRALEAQARKNGARRDGSPHHPSSTLRTPETRALEDDLRRALGTKVELIRSHRGGKIIIEFYSDEELDAIYRKIVI
jgi:ParB family transcriptional regulator, chromosome partitioning protein